MVRRFTIQDPVLFFLVLLATLVGMIFIFDAGYARAIGTGKASFGSIPPEFLAQLKFLIPAVGLGLLFANLMPGTLRRFAPWFWGIGIALLIFVHFKGTVQNGARRWMPLGPFTFQPAEFTKFFAILYLSNVFADREAWVAPKKRIAHWAEWMDRVAIPKLQRFMPAFWLLVVSFLIEKEKDLGTATIVLMTSLIIFFAGRVSRSSMIWLCGLALMGGLVFAKLEPYRMERITNHFARWEPSNVDDVGYQTVQSEIGMASGGLFGVGLGNGRAKHVIPAPTTDFIMATVAEETGLFGSVCVLSILGVIVWRMIWLSRRAPDEFGKLVLIGSAAWIGVQSITNYVMANATAPAIGVPLPFFSSGGSSLMALWMTMGACLAVMNPERVHGRNPNKEAAHAASGQRRRNRRARLSGA
ncbi:MAG: FtsW/RodA/SpoVE family cell cycle protein [Armatimonadetes bacterium]|nr:FtsW/RodA/SpoVE family cell cycle protein [Armatimonadota bacterium]